MKKIMAAVLAAIWLLTPFAAMAEGEYSDKETVKAVQEALNEAGFECGAADGIAGRKTGDAISRYQEANGLEVTGEIGRDLLIAMGFISVCEEEIVFQEIPWGTDAQTVRNTLVASGFADPDVTHGTGSGIVIFPETCDNMLSMDMDAEYELTFEGGYRTGVTPLKAVGGHPASSVNLSYLFGIHDGVIDQEDTRLTAVWVNYDNLSEEESAAIAADLLVKLEARYGMFEKYVSQRYIDALTAYADANEIELGRMQTGSGLDKLVCICYGSNHTAVILTVDGWNWVNLIYTRTDSWQDEAALLEIISAAAARMDDAGL